MNFFQEDRQYKNTIQITRKLYKVLTMCVSVDETRYFMEYPYINKERKGLYATDGRSIIIIDIPFELKEIESGHCIPVKSKNDYYLIPKKYNCTFPSIEKVIPNYEDANIKFSGKYYPGKSDKVFKDNSIFLYRLQEKTGCLVNIKYLKVLKYLGDFTVRSDGDEKAIEFCGNGWKYVLMPMVKNKIKEVLK